MLIQTMRPPVAGQNFRFSIGGASGETRVAVSVNGQGILERIYHTMLCQAAAAIPTGSAGQRLTVTATDSRGNRKTLEYEISEVDPGPHSMLTVSRQRTNAPSRIALVR